MQRYRHLTDSAGEWLKAYVHSPLDAWPSQDVLQDLLATAPYQGGTIYRGLNFRTEAEWNRFAEQTNGFTAFQSDGVTSWSRFAHSANQYCLTRPTYELNRDLMEDQSRQSRERDYMIGFAGVVLRLEAAAGAGIDLSQTEHASSEAEVILAPGEYRISLEKVEIPFQRSINEANLDEQLLGIDPQNPGLRGQAKFTHIINRFSEFTEPQRRHLFQLARAFTSTASCGAVLSTRDDYITGSAAPLNLINVWLDLPDEYVDHYEKFLPEDQALIDKEMADAIKKVDREFVAVTKNLDWNGSLFHVMVSTALAAGLAAGRIRADFPLVIDRAIGQHHAHWTSVNKIREISELSPAKKARAMRSLGARVAHLLNQRVSMPRQRQEPSMEQRHEQRRASSPRPR